MPMRWHFPLRAGLTVVASGSKSWVSTRERVMTCDHDYEQSYDADRACVVAKCKHCGEEVSSGDPRRERVAAAARSVMTGSDDEVRAVVDAVMAALKGGE